MNVFAIILAAGKGSRMKSKYHKGTHKVCGKEMINIIIDKLNKCGIEDINVVVGEHRESLIEVTKDKNLSYSIQEQQLGTGHAVLSACNFLKGKRGSVLIFACDVPLFEEENIKKMIDAHQNQMNSLTFVTSILDDGLSYGRIIRENGRVICIKEAKDCSKEELLINEINTSIYCFDIDVLLNSISEIKNLNAQNEFYLTDVVEIIHNKNKNIGTICVDKDQVIGVDTRKQLVYANEILRKKIIDYHISNGVTILNPESTYIDVDVKIEKDVILHPNVFLYGNTLIQEDCEIFSNTKIVNSIIGRNTEVESSVIYGSKIGENTTIGPFAHLRLNSFVGDNVKIGDFVELKNCNIGDGTKIPHLSYVGDADVGKKCNLGCGIVTVNYNGVNKNRTIIGDECFIGCNVNLVAPVVVESKSYIAAGTTITEKVDSNSLAIGRCRQKNIKNWVFKKLNK